MMRLVAALSLLGTLTGAARPAVVVNEILYHPPGERDDLQFVELHNTGGEPVDLGGWRLKGARYQFPAGTAIPGGGFLVVGKDPAAFKRHYGVDAVGPFEGTLGRGGGRVELTDARGGKVDAVRYQTRTPWPVSPDGNGPSLERICPTAPGDGPENWAASPYPAGPPRAAGTPGKRNAAHAPRLPPVVADVTFAPARPTPGAELRVEADVRSADGVELRYRAAGPGVETEETAVPMAKAANGRYAAVIPGHTAGQIVRFRVRATDAAGGVRTFPSEHDLRPALSAYVHDGARPGKVPFGYVVNVGRDEFRAARQDVGKQWGAPPGPDPPARGRSAFVYVGTKTGEPELFDFVAVTPRTAGRKVRFHKDRPLDGMTTVNLIYEYLDRFVLAEPLAYEVYRRAGNAASRTDFVRTWIDGRPVGFQLLVEQPNKAFLRHNKLDPDGHLYKCVWFGQGVVGQHEKKTRVREGHADLVKIVTDLNRATGDAQWAVIEKNFDVRQVATYFAVAAVLSDWDGYFNNYFAYHDTEGTGKWTLYPWDQDKTWGFHDGIQGSDVFTDMPITFGMTDDAPPGWPKGRPAPRGFGYNAWWRPPGHLSGPLLANPKFRQVFLARTKDILEKVYTEAAFGPVITATGDRVAEEVEVRMKLGGQDPTRGREQLARDLGSLREHLTKRRAFLLAQEEIKK